MAWTKDDGEALFRQPAGEQDDHEPPGVFDSSEAARRRMRFPFEADPADVVEQEQEVPQDDDEYRG